MKELICTASNIAAIIDSENGKLLPQAEVVIITSEAVYRRDEATRDLTRQRHTFEFRFVASPAALRGLATAMLDTAEHTETALSRALDLAAQTTGPVKP